MAQFLADIAFLLELVLVAAGLTLVHFARERAGAGMRAGLLRIAGWVLVVGGTATALCTGYFWLRYHQAGDFDRAYGSSVVEESAAKLDSLDITLPT